MMKLHEVQLMLTSEASVSYMVLYNIHTSEVFSILASLQALYTSIEEVWHNS